MKRASLVAGLVIFALLLVVPPLLKNYGIYLFTYWLVFIIATMGLNLTIGYAGQKSLGHAAFFGIGAYTVAILMKAGFSFWFGLPVAMLGCFVIGLALGFPALRVQTIYLAFATLGFNTAVWLVMRNEEWLTGGTFGINNIAGAIPLVGTIQMILVGDTEQEGGWVNGLHGLFALVVLVLAAVIAHRTMRALGLRAGPAAT